YRCLFLLSSKDKIPETKPYRVSLKYAYREDTFIKKLSQYSTIQKTAQHHFQNHQLTNKI
ncbi:MAG: hypothetical protein ACKPKO_62405, partial [Candidatus Fonsibacter sp.]